MLMKIDANVELIVDELTEEEDDGEIES
jgi:hypothetical protein